MILILLIAFLTSCHSPAEPLSTSFSGETMEMEYLVTVGNQLNSNESIQVRQVIDETFQQIYETFSTYNPNSELSRFNQMPAGTMNVSDSMVEMIQLTDEAVKLTEGRFDPTVAPLHELWVRSLGEGKKPGDHDIASLLPAIGWNRISLNGNLLSKSHDQTMIDLGGIAKGHAIDLIADRLQQLGYSNLFIVWGGEIKAIGHHPEGRPWTVAVRHPSSLDPKDAIAIVNLNGEAIATSGDYLQQWSVASEQFTHILDPTTYQLLTVKPGAIASVTVTAERCSLADALATSAMISGSSKDIQEWVNRLEEQGLSLKIWVATRD